MLIVIAYSVLWVLCGVPAWALFFNYALDTVFAWEVLVLVHMYGPALCLNFV